MFACPCFIRDTGCADFRVPLVGVYLCGLAAASLGGGVSGNPSPVGREFWFVVHFPKWGFRAWLLNLICEEIQFHLSSWRGGVPLWGRGAGGLFLWLVGAFLLAPLSVGLVVGWGLSCLF